MAFQARDLCLARFARSIDVRAPVPLFATHVTQPGFAAVRSRRLSAYRQLMLAKRNAPGPIPVRALLDMAVQIADGLASAHAAHIVHRDLKPANVMITSDGRIKILDFGLAKQGVPAAGRDETIAANHTVAGMIVGTVNYMSPDQARGAAVDHRSDQLATWIVCGGLLIAPDGKTERSIGSHRSPHYVFSKDGRLLYALRPENGQIRCFRSMSPAARNAPSPPGSDSSRAAICLRPSGSAWHRTARASAMARADQKQLVDSGRLQSARHAGGASRRAVEPVRASRCRRMLAGDWVIQRDMSVRPVP